MYEALEPERVWIPPLREVLVRVAFAVAAARAAARASICRFVLIPSAFKSSISFVGVPSSVILNLGESSGRMASSLVAEKGAFCIPGFGAIKSFWLSMGICSVSARRAVRSCRVVSGERSWRV